MSFRFITKSIHAYLIDYPVAIVLIAAPFALKLGQSGPVAMWLSVAVGVAALLLAALTDHPTGLVRIIPYWLHLGAIDPNVALDVFAVRLARLSPRAASSTPCYGSRIFLTAMTPSALGVTR